MSPRARATNPSKAVGSRGSPAPRQTTEAKPSHWETKLDITPRHKDRTQWDRDWEKRAKTVKPMKVFDWLGRQLSERVPANCTLPNLRDLTLSQQTCAGQLVSALFAVGSVVGTWLLLPEEERRRHVDAGLEGACKESPLGVDARIFCPEISMKAMLKSGGQAYIDYVKGFLELNNAVEPGQFIVFPCSGWDDVANSRSQPLSDRDKLILALGALHREYFIVTFVMESARSMLRDMVEGNNAVGQIQELASKDRTMAAFMAHSMKLITTEQSIKCETCKKRPGDEDTEKFSVCGTCKNTIKTSVYYCSRACQKADWPKHKFTCGIKPPASKRVNMDLAEQEDGLQAFIEDMALLRTEGEFELRSEDYPPALGLQVEMLEEYQFVDYMLRDAAGKWHPYLTEDPVAQKIFRISRRGALTGLLPDGALCIGQHMIMAMEKQNKAGLDRRTIMKQLKAEWGDDYDVRLAQFERQSMKQHGRGRSMIESLAGGMDIMLPNIMSTLLARKKR